MKSLSIENIDFARVDPVFQFIPNLESLEVRDVQYSLENFDSILGKGRKLKNLSITGISNFALDACVHILGDRNVETATMKKFLIAVRSSSEQLWEDGDERVGQSEDHLRWLVEDWEKRMKESVSRVLPEGSEVEMNGDYVMEQLVEEWIDVINKAVLHANSLNSFEQDRRKDTDIGGIGHFPRLSHTGAPQTCPARLLGSI
ncbi:hypothetical protein HDV00_006852 [Rhizophlyctis rosea]|nr:hypothetical protein HDV00_006852 [Rhizophlyctis rosea]